MIGTDVNELGAAAPGVTSPPRPRRRDLVRRGAGLIISIVAIAAIVAWASGQPAPHFPTRASKWMLLVVATAVYGLATILRGWRWHVILRLDGIPHRRRDALGLVIVGYMGNTVLPARGGEVLRVFLLGQRSGARKTNVLGSILAERGLDAAVLAILFVALTIFGVGGAPAGVLPAFIAAAGVVAVGFGGLAYIRLRRAGKLQSFGDRVRPIASASRPLWGPMGLALGVVTAIVWVLEGVLYALVASSLGLHVTVDEGIFINVLAAFFALIPAAPGYVGTFDAAMLFGLHHIGIRGGAAVSFAVLVRFVLFVPITVLGGILLVTSYGGIGTLRRMRAGT